MAVGDDWCSESLLQMLLRVGAPWLKTSTGLPAVDSLLQGSLSAGIITEFIGETCSGKTQLCYSLVAEFLADPEKGTQKAVWLDSNGSFRARRLLQVMDSRRQARGTEQALSRLLVRYVFDGRQLLEALRQIQNLENLQLVVIDSFGTAAATFLPSLSNSNEPANVLVEAIELVQKVARSGRVVVCVNHGSEWQGEWRAALGPQWSPIPAVRLRFYRLENSRVVVVSEKPEKLENVKLRLCDVSLEE